ncbi:MAG: VOC family protein [Pseudomonadota bacterium]
MNLNQVTLAVSDFDASVAFYKRLGLALIVHAPSKPYARFECPDGQSTLSLHGGDVPASTISLYFEVDDLAKRYEELESAGITFETQPTEQSWLWTEAWFKDPDGHSLCLYHAGEARKNPPWRLTDP